MPLEKFILVNLPCPGGLEIVVPRDYTYLYLTIYFLTKVVGISGLVDLHFVLFDILKRYLFKLV